MSKPRRMGPEDSQMRARFVDAAAQVLETKGYPHFSARHVAEQAGLKTQLIYYYFQTLDDLLLEVVRKANERRWERFEAALASDDPLRALWDLNSDPTGATLGSELTSIAAHRDTVRSEIVRSARLFRVRQTEAVKHLLRGRGEEASAAGLVLIAAALGRFVVTEASLGLDEGHAEALQIVERMLSQLSRDADS